MKANIKSRAILTLGGIGLSLIAAHPASAVVSIGINLGSMGTASTTLTATQFAGVVPQDNFNNFGASGNTGVTSIGTLVDSTGAPTGVNAYLTSGGYYQGGNHGGGTVNSSMPDQILNGTGQYGTPRIAIENIPYASYDVIVYTQLDQGSAQTFGVALTPYSGHTTGEFVPTTAAPNGATNIGATQGISGDTPPNGTTPGVFDPSTPNTPFPYVAATGTGTHTVSGDTFTASNPNAGANYAEFTGLTTSSDFIEVYNLSRNNPALDGIQIIDTASVSAAPEPSQIGMLALMGFGLAGLMLKARKRTAFVSI